MDDGWIVWTSDITLSSIEQLQIVRKEQIPLDTFRRRMQGGCCVIPSNILD